MADMSTPLNWDKPERPSRRHASSAAIAAGAGSHEKGSREAFLWPTPPYASYPAPTEQTETLPCQLMTGSQAERKFTSGRLTFFVPDTGVAHVQVPPARTTVRCASTSSGADPDDAAAAAAAAAGRPARRPAAPARAARPTSVQLRRRRRAERQTSATSRPSSACSSSRRSTTTAASSACSCRARAYAGFEIGPRIGEVLVEQHARHAASRSTQARRRAGASCASRKLGDILVTQQIVIARAAARGDRAPGTGCRWCASARR